MDDEMQIIEKSPFVNSPILKMVFFWSIEVKDPATNRTVATSISPYARLNSLGEVRGIRSYSHAIAEWLNVRESTMRNSMAHPSRTSSGHTSTNTTRLSARPLQSVRAGRSSISCSTRSCGRLRPGARHKRLPPQRLTRKLPRK